MFSWLRSTSLLTLAAILVTSASAQFPGGPPQGGPPGPPTQLMLLSQKSVQTELKLNATQLKKLNEAWTKEQAATRAQGNLTAEQRAKKIEEQKEASDRTVGETLQNDQKKRLREISLQLGGPKAYSDPQIVKELDLTADQQFQIGAIDEAFRAQMGPPPGAQGGGGKTTTPPSPEAMRKKITELHKSAEEKFVKLLNEEQKKKWKELTGKPFTGDVRLGPPGPPPR